MGLQETNLTKRIEKWWKTQGSYVVKFHANNFTTQGISDIIICHKGRFIALEVKYGNNKPTPLQLKHIEMVKDWYGGFAEWVNETNWLEISERIIKEINND